MIKGRKKCAENSPPMYIIDWIIFIFTHYRNKMPVKKSRHHRRSQKNKKRRMTRRKQRGGVYLEYTINFKVRLQYFDNIDRITKFASEMDVQRLHDKIVQWYHHVFNELVAENRVPNFRQFEIIYIGGAMFRLKFEHNHHDIDDDYDRGMDLIWYRNPEYEIIDEENQNRVNYKPIHNIERIDIFGDVPNGFLINNNNENNQANNNQP